MESIHDTMMSLMQEQVDADLEKEAIYEQGDEATIEKFEIKQAEEAFAQHRLADRMSEAGSLEQQRVILFEKVADNLITHEEAEKKYSALALQAERKRVADRDARYKAILEAVTKPNLPAIECPSANMLGLPGEDTTADSVIVEEEDAPACTDADVPSSLAEDIPCVPRAVTSEQPVGDREDEYWTRYRKLLKEDNAFVEFVYTEYCARLRRQRANKKPNNSPVRPIQQQQVPTEYKPDPLPTNTRRPVPTTAYDRLSAQFELASTSDRECPTIESTTPKKILSDSLFD